MPLPLREPFFLKGRTSVVQRAIIMSVVLGVAASLAGWALGVVTCAAFNNFKHSLVRHAICLAWAIAATVTIYAPLNHWNRRSVLWTIAALPASYGLAILFLKLATAPGTTNGVPRVLILFVCMATMSGLLLMRYRSLHYLAYGTSVAVAVIPLVALFTVAHSTVLHRLAISEDLLYVMQIAAVVGSWLASLAIPWGIPFWWPPEKDS